MKSVLKEAKLQVSGQYYKPVITPPSPEAVIDLSMVELDRVLKTNVQPGQVFEKHNSKFQAYMMGVMNHQQIKDAYLKLRLLHPRARHIMCAYILNNSPDPYQKDFCDDGETSAGRMILNIMENHKMISRAVFVVRYFGENKLGGDRFKLIENAVTSALEENGYNEVLRIEQPLQKTKTIIARTQRNTASQMNKRGSYTQRHNHRGQPNKGGYRGALMSNSRMRQGLQRTRNRGNYRWNQRTYPSRGIRGARPMSTQSSRYQGNSQQDRYYKRKREGDSPPQYNFSHPREVGFGSLGSQEEEDYSSQLSQDEYPDSNVATSNWGDRESTHENSENMIEG